jgi:hypothetical protein
MGFTSGLCGTDEVSLGHSRWSGNPLLILSVLEVFTGRKGCGTDWAVVVFRAEVTGLLAPADLEEAAAADLTHTLTGSLVHTCPKSNISSLHPNQITPLKCHPFKTD